MKILCDVCNKNEASVFCSADEAALCNECDQRVHFANKLASKHHRFSLIQPSSSHFPICDICQDKRALLFCQQDRAILCRECDIPLHTANEYTQKHHRFLLTGTKLSATISDKKNDNVAGTDTAVPDHFKSFSKPNSSVLSEIPTTTTVVNNSSNNSNSSSNNNKNNFNPAVNSVNDQQMISGGSATTSNISDYLIDDALEGWHFDDFILDPPSSIFAPFGFCKSNTNCCEVHEDILSFFNTEHEKNHFTQTENLWVPQAPRAATTIVFGQPSIIHNHNNNTTTSVFAQGTTKQQQEISVKHIGSKFNKKINNRREDAFTVPQITSSVGSKRGRSFW